MSMCYCIHVHSVGANHWDGYFWQNIIAKGAQKPVENLIMILILILKHTIMFYSLWFWFHSYPTNCYQTHTSSQNLQSAPRTTKEFIKIRQKFINSGRRANTMGPLQNGHSNYHNDAWLSRLKKMGRPSNFLFNTNPYKCHNIVKSEVKNHISTYTHSVWKAMLWSGVSFWVHFQQYKIQWLHKHTVQ